MEQIKSLINYDEEIYFEGTYNLNDVDQTGPTILSVNVEIQNNYDGYNILIDNFYNTQDKLLPPNDFLLETITIASYQNDIKLKVGQIEYTSFYKNNSSSDSATTNENFLLYLVNNSNGIYSGITKVYLNALTEQRILYFVGKKNNIY
jgi:hypothetical protein